MRDVPSRVTQEVNKETPGRDLRLNYIGVYKLPTGDTEPVVSNLQYFFAPDDAITLVNFKGGQDGQSIHILGNDLASVDHNANIKRSTQAVGLLKLDQVYTFTFYIKPGVDFGIWYEEACCDDGGITARWEPIGAGTPGDPVGPYKQIAFRPSDNIGISVDDHAAENEIDVTIRAETTTRVDSGANLQRPRLNFISGVGITVSQVDDPGDNETEITIDATGAAAPAAHASTHEDGGSDEINVTDLSGLLADPQTPLAHAASHEDTGLDEINVNGLSGVLADAQKITVRKNTGADVGTRHRLNLIEGTNITLTVTDDAGSNEIDITIDAAGGSSIAELDDVPDVNAPTPADNDILSFESTGSEWINRTLSALLDTL